MSPLISVIMPVYNCAAFMEEAVRSILEQTVSDFELIIIDDASIDNTADIARKFGDERIKIFQKTENTGYTQSLNIGLDMSRGKFIARMDGDDISMPSRFEKQLKFFEKYPNAIVCGTNYRFLNSDIESIHPSLPERTKVYLLGGCYIAHPTVMFKKSVLSNNSIYYNPEYEPAEDYNLWVRLSRFGDIGNVEEILLHYRTHERQVSLTQSERQLKFTDVARRGMLKYLVPENEISKKDWEIHLSLMRGWENANFKKQEFILWIKRLNTENANKKVFHAEYLNKFLQEKLQIFLKNRRDSKVSFAKRLDWKSRMIAKKVLYHLKLRSST